ncbi:MAG: endolytic transglycosylase MltG, partial [Ruminococcus sp.]|nr:endolytic transglycosylase MltG [Ruminococcus sp.]
MSDERDDNLGLDDGDDYENVNVDTFHETGEIPLPPPDEPYTPTIEDENETDIELPPPLPPMQPYGEQPQPMPRTARPATGKKKKRKKKKQRSRLPGVLILTTFIFGISVVLALVIIGFGKDMFGIGKSDKTHLIVIPENATTEEIAAMLENDGIIKSPKFFTIFSQLRSADIPYIAGEHFVRPNMAYETIINELTSVEEEDIKESVEVTFPEGITIIDAAKILEENGVCSAEDFIFYFNSGGYGYEFENHLTSDTSIKFMRM